MTDRRGNSDGPASRPEPEVAAIVLARIRRASRLMTWLPVAGYAIMLAVIGPGLLRMLLGFHRSPIGDAEVARNAWLAGFCWLVVGAQLALLRACRRIGDRLQSSTGMDQLGNLIDAAGYGRVEFYEACAERLRVITLEEATALDAVKLTKLRAMAEASTPFRRYPTALRVAALHALALAGYLKALPQIDRLAKRAKHQEVRAAAAEAAAKLRALQAGGTLLRPADGAADELLRPAGGATEPEVLLRPSDAEMPLENRDGSL